MQQEVDIGKPYTNYKIINSFIRIFDETLNKNELLWHNDEHDRIIYVIDGIDWKLQLDNELPVFLKKDSSYMIPGKTYHRLIKGIDKLVLKIDEYTV